MEPTKFVSADDLLFLMYSLLKSKYDSGGYADDIADKKTSDSLDQQTLRNQYLKLLVPDAPEPSVAPTNYSFKLRE